MRWVKDWVPLRAGHHREVHCPHLCEHLCGAKERNCGRMRIESGRQEECWTVTARERRNVSRGQTVRSDGPQIEKWGEYRAAFSFIPKLGMTSLYSCGMGYFGYYGRLVQKMRISLGKISLTGCKWSCLNARSAETPVSLPV